MSNSKFPEDMTKRNSVIDIGRRPKEATAPKNGRIIDAAAPEANMTARRPWLADLSDDSLMLRVRSGTVEATLLTRGIRSFAIPDLPSEYVVN